jgi:hypothetical protein
VLFDDISEKIVYCKSIPKMYLSGSVICRFTEDQPILAPGSLLSIGGVTYEIVVLFLSTSEISLFTGINQFSTISFIPSGSYPDSAGCAGTGGSHRDVAG